MSAPIKTRAKPSQPILNAGCRTMRKELDPPERVKIETLAEQRRRRLRIGAPRWQRDVLNDGRPIGRVHLIGLTTADPDVDKMAGAIRLFITHLRMHAKGIRFFWWAEFQRRGAIHYHVILLDSPFANTALAQRWVAAHWPYATTYSVLERGEHWFRLNGVRYVRHTIKRESEAELYRQDYAQMPKGWHCVGSHRLAFATAVHQEHETKVEAQCICPVTWWRMTMRGKVIQVHLDWRIFAIRIHVPPPGGCRLDPRLRRSNSNRAKRGREGCRSRRGSEAVPLRARTRPEAASASEEKNRVSGSSATWLTSSPGKHEPPTRA